MRKIKQLAILFIVLFTSFFGTWIYKLNVPINRPDEYADGYSETAGQWWNTDVVKVDDDWRLDPEIEPNYIPVPGEDELYMVVDNDGNIIKYRRRIKQIDGSWKWEDVNPDIPDNYEPVEGLENVYKVTQEDGTVKYLKYIRNEDDTYAFVEVDENGNPINLEKDATVIDGKHVHISGNIYRRLNENGVSIGYEKRVDNGDGSFTWMNTELPDVSGYLNDVGGEDADQGIGLTLQTPSMDTSAMDAFANQMNNLANSGGETTTTVTTYSGFIPGEDYGGDYGYFENEGMNYPNATDPFAAAANMGTTVINNPDGTHTEVETVKDIQTIDGVRTVYETYIKKTYDDAGNLISTFSEGPVLVDEQESIIPETKPAIGDASAVAETLDAETSRVTGSYTYNTDIGSNVFALVNAQRAQKGLPVLQTSDVAMKIAALRAADMASYDVSTGNLPTYGSLGSMISKFGITSASPGENLWRTTSKNAEDINMRFQSVDSSRATRMNEKVSQYGIAIAEKNGYIYICEVFL